MRMAVAEIVVADDDVARLHLGPEIRVVALHGGRRELLDILDLDVLDADDLVDIEVALLEDEGDAAAQVRQGHG
jgi:hypothetical protein